MSETASEPGAPSDADILAAIRSGDTSAYDLLYKRHMAAAKGLARQLVHDPAKVDDVVSETFVRVLDLLKRGGGPGDAFRPYLLTAVRRKAYDLRSGERRQVVTADMEALDPGVPFIDPAVEGLERRLITRAFLSLPERWQAVLWHMEIEGEKPADIAPMLGLTANSVAALAYRAREGLSQAYLQMHLSGGARQECRPVAEKLGAYVRGRLSRRESAVVADHLDGCADCRSVYGELDDVNAALRGDLAPFVLGPAAATYLAAGGAKGGLLGWFLGPVRWLRHAPKHQQAVAAGVAAAVVAAALAALAAGTPPHHHKKPRYPAAAPTRSAPPSQHPGSAPAPAPSASAPPLAVPAHTPPPSAAASAHRTVAKPAPPAPAPSPAHLVARINPVGALLPGSVGSVAFDVVNQGRQAVKNLTASITLPPGVSYVSGGALGLDAPQTITNPGDWICAPVAAGASCTHGPLQPGADAPYLLNVDVATTAPVGGSVPSIAVSSGSSHAGGRGSIGVLKSGLRARYYQTGVAADVTMAGSSLARSERQEPRSGEASLALPRSVLWAGLYWSWTGDQASLPIELQGPGQDVPQLIGTGSGTPPGRSDCPGYQAAAAMTNCPDYQAFALVTGVVRKYGSGVWRAIIPPNGNGMAGPAGWELVVVSGHPGALADQVMVLDGAHGVTAADPSYGVPLDGLLPRGSQAGVHAMTWDSDRGRPDVTTSRVASPSPQVSFAYAGDPYLVGVVAATVPPGIMASSETTVASGNTVLTGNRVLSGNTDAQAVSQGSENLAFPGRVEPGPGSPLKRCDEAFRPTVSKAPRGASLGGRPPKTPRGLKQPSPGVAHRVGERPVPDAGKQCPLAGNLPGPGQVRYVRRPERQLVAGLDARREQHRVVRPDETGGCAGPGTRDVHADP